MLRRCSLMLIVVFACLYATGDRVEGAEVPCMVVSAAYSLTCFAPGDVQQAMHSLHTSIINPTSTVKRVTGLSFTQVITLKRVLPSPSHGVVGVEFVYGGFPSGLQGPPDPSPSLPAWAVVTEWAKHYKGSRAPRVWQSTSQTPAATMTRTNDWYAEANAPHHVLAFDIVTNEGKNAVREMIRALVARV
jgi:hypothetical protein